ncbi:MAG: type II toxin-antitoxin system RelE/ParE family toxin [Vulcanimicrobiaceae bacterium]
MGDAKDVVSRLPRAPKREVGQALWEAQTGTHSHHAKPLKGDLREVHEIVIDDARGERTFRVVYTVKIGDALYILHAFTKKSRRGIATDRRDLDLIRKRLNDAKSDEQTNR